MHPCICVKTAQADNAWPDLKVTSLTCSADWACEAIRSTDIFLPRVVWIPEGFTRTMMSWMKRVGCLFLDVFCFNDMAAVCTDGHMDVFPSFFSLCLFSPAHMGLLHLRVDSVRDLQSVWAAMLLKSVCCRFHTSFMRYCPVSHFHAGLLAYYTRVTSGLVLWWERWECWYLDSTEMLHCLCHFTSFKNQNCSLHLYAQIDYFRIGLSSKCIK